MRNEHLGEAVPHFIDSTAGAVPEPAAFLATINDQKSIVTTFREEPTNAEWASKMEEALKSFFAPVALKAQGLSGLRLAEIQCHSSSCFLAIDTPTSLRDHPPPSRFEMPTDRKWSAVDVLQWNTGVLGSVIDTIKFEEFAQDGQPYERQSMVVAFSEQLMDPTKYSRSLEKTWISKRTPVGSRKPKGEP